jgi:hypothetical protein
MDRLGDRLRRRPREARPGSLEGMPVCWDGRREHVRQRIWWRQIPAGGEVHHQPNPPADSRWQRGEVIDALYYAAETTRAEWYRAAEAACPVLAIEISD